MQINIASIEIFTNKMCSLYSNIRFVCLDLLFGTTVITATESEIERNVQHNSTYKIVSIVYILFSKKSVYFLHQYKLYRQQEIINKLK